MNSYKFSSFFFFLSSEVGSLQLHCKMWCQWRRQVVDSTAPCSNNTTSDMSEITGMRFLMTASACANVIRMWSGAITLTACAGCLQTTLTSQTAACYSIYFALFSFSHSTTPPSSFSFSLHPTIPASQMSRINVEIRCSEKLRVCLCAGTYVCVCVS